MLKQYVGFPERLAGGFGVDDRNDSGVETHPDEEGFSGQVGGAHWHSFKHHEISQLLRCAREAVPLEWIVGLIMSTKAGRAPTYLIEAKLSGSNGDVRIASAAEVCTYSLPH